MIVECSECVRVCAQQEGSRVLISPRSTRTKPIETFSISLKVNLTLRNSSTPVGSNSRETSIVLCESLPSSTRNDRACSVFHLLLSHPVSLSHQTINEREMLTRIPTTVLVPLLPSLTVPSCSSPWHVYIFSRVGNANAYSVQRERKKTAHIYGWSNIVTTRTDRGLTLPISPLTVRPFFPCASAAPFQPSPSYPHPPHLSHHP